MIEYNYHLAITRVPVDTPLIIDNEEVLTIQWLAADGHRADEGNIGGTIHTILGRSSSEIRMIKAGVTALIWDINLHEGRDGQ